MLRRKFCTIPIISVSFQVLNWLERVSLTIPNKPLQDLFSPVLLIIQLGDEEENWGWSPNGVAKATQEATFAGNLLL